jgi:hypothetical protein
MCCERKEIKPLAFLSPKTPHQRKDIDAYFDNNLKQIKRSKESTEIEISLDNPIPRSTKNLIYLAALYTLLLGLKYPKKKTRQYTL